MINRKLGLILLIVLSASYGCSNRPDVPSYLKDYSKEYRADPRKANLKWFTDAGYGLFIHYGLYSNLGRGEWVQLNDTIPVAEYAKLKDIFTAEKFDADFITDLVLDAGMKYITITSKHHDGFCLFKTTQTDFNSLSSPCGRDLIGELYQASERKGIGLFLYYSYGVDWKHPYAYEYDPKWRGSRPAYKEPQPEYKYAKPEDFKIYIDFAHAQLKELLTQYPNIAGIWLDPIVGYYSKPELFPIDSTYKLIRSLSPHALISFKQGANGEEDFRAPERNAAAIKSNQWPAALIAEEENRNKPVEICNTLQKSAWGYNKSEDGKHKTSEEVLKILEDARTRGANLLLNTGPKGDGSIPEEDVITLREAGKKLNFN
jgi:alpha-L-fucosidase